MSKKKITMTERVFDYLVDNGSITTWDAITELGATRLSAAIFDLKKDGCVFNEEWIHTTNRFGDKVSYKKYILGSIK